MNVFIKDTTMKEIANAIREKNGEQALYKPSEMPKKIKEILLQRNVPMLLKEVGKGVNILVENGTLKAIADAIRETTHTEGLILPRDMPQMIRSIQTYLKGNIKGNPCIMKDSANGKVLDMAVKGFMKQVQTSGKNLLPYPYMDSTIIRNEVTFTDNKDGSVSVSGIAIKDTQFTLVDKIGNIKNATLTGCPKGGSKDTYYLLQENSGRKDTGNGVLLPHIDGEYRYFKIIIKQGTKCDNLLFKPMLIENPNNEFKPIIIPYEPYTGGQPSPSPDYPQEVNMGECDHITYGNNADISIKKVFEKIQLSEWDRVFKEDGVWKKENWTKTIDLSTLIFNKGLYGTNSWYASMIDVTFNETDINIHSDKFKGIPYYLRTVSESNLIYIEGSPKSIYIRNTDITNIKEYLIRHNTYATYRTETPTLETLPQETQQALNQIQTFNPNSVIQTNEGLEMDITYLKRE